MLSSLFYKKIDLETIEKSKEIIEASLSYFLGNNKAANQLADVMDPLLTEEQILDLQVEFTSLFLLPSGVRPYESVYRGEKFQLKQEPWLEVKRFYYQCGFKLDESSGFLEDHISAELNFMSHLIEEEKHDLVRRFFNNHIGQWMPKLLEDITKSTDAAFYKKVAEYAAEFIESEKKILIQNC